MYVWLYDCLLQYETPRSTRTRSRLLRVASRSSALARRCQIKDRRAASITVLPGTLTSTRAFSLRSTRMRHTGTISMSTPVIFADLMIFEKPSSGVAIICGTESGFRLINDQNQFTLKSFLYIFLCCSYNIFMFLTSCLPFLQRQFICNV